MDLFLASTSGLILGLVLLVVAATDYVALRFFWHRLNPQSDERLNKLREFGAYWIAAFAAAGLFFILQYLRRQ